LHRRCWLDLGAAANVRLSAYGTEGLSMLRHLSPLILFPGVLLVTSPAVGQAKPAQEPIVCDIQDNIEDAGCQDQLKDMFTRDGDTLILRLNNGKSKTFVGNRAACDGENVDAGKCLVFYVVSYFPQTQSYLVKRGRYECGDYLFVSRRTGSETLTSEIPLLSPNAKYLLSVDQSDACDRKYDIAIWSMHTDPPTLEFKYQPKQYENWQVEAWESDTRINMKGWINGETLSYDQEAVLLRKGKSWILDLGKKVDSPR
jgi:hypothetical protein